MKYLLILLATVALAQSAIEYGPPYHDIESPPMPNDTCTGDMHLYVDSRHYWKCQNDRWIWWTCSPRFVVNMVVKFPKFDCIMIPSEQSTATPSPPIPRGPPVTSPTHICTPGTTRLDVSNTANFELCVGGFQWVPYVCQSGSVYDPMFPEFCRYAWVLTTTTQSPGRSCTKGSYEVYQDDCRAYLQCYRGYWMLRKCDGEKRWDQMSLKCVDSDLFCTEDYKPLPPTSSPNGRPTRF